MPRNDLNADDPVFSRRFQVEGLPDGVLDLQRINRLVMERVGSRFNPLAYAKQEPHNILRMYIAAWVLAVNVDDEELEEALDTGNGGFVDVWSEHMFIGAVREARSRFLASGEAQDLITMILKLVSNHNFHDAYQYVLMLLTLPSDHEEYTKRLKKAHTRSKAYVKRSDVRDDAHVWRVSSRTFKDHAEQTMRRILQILSNDLTAAQVNRFSLTHVESSFRGYLEAETLDRVQTYVMALRDPVFSALIDSSVTERTVRPAVSRLFGGDSVGQGLLQAMNPGDSIEESDKEDMYRQVLARLGYENIERALDLLQGNYSEYVTEDNQVDYTYEDHAAANPDMSPQELRQTFISRDPSSDLREEGAQIRRHLLEAATDEELRILTYIKPLEQYEPEGDLLDYDTLAQVAAREDDEESDEEGGVQLDSYPDPENLDTLFSEDNGVEDLEGLWDSAPAPPDPSDLPNLSHMMNAAVDEDLATPLTVEEEANIIARDMLQEMQDMLPEVDAAIDADLEHDRVSVEDTEGRTLISYADDLGLDDSEDDVTEEE